VSPDCDKLPGMSRAKIAVAALVAVLAIGSLCSPTEAAPVTPAPTTTASVSKSLGALNASVALALGGNAGANITIPAGVVGTVTPRFSFDWGTTYFSDPMNPSFIIPLATNSASGSLTVPVGATHVQATLTAWTSGSSTVGLRSVTSVNTVARSIASGALTAATASVTSTTGNFVAIPVDPTRWASVVLTTTATASTATLMWDTLVGGAWMAAPYATLQGATNTTAASVAYTTTAADTWDIPVPMTATAMRVRSSAVGGTPGSVTASLAPGRPRGLEPRKNRYTASVVGLVPIAAATDIWMIQGSATKTVVVERIALTGTQTTGGEVTIALLRRSTIDGADGGTPTVPTIVSFDTVNPTATAVVTAYPFLPALGGSVGHGDVQTIYVPATTAAGDLWVWPPPSKEGILHNGEAFVISLNGVTVTGGSINIAATWTEE
jgi:hypothetical protein